ncbi:MAG: hypothetical protein LBQ73_09000 [Tannerellaceae bacterium]|nr:hypothetical protein [Tannerellaceae bacterium]
MEFIPVSGDVYNIKSYHGKYLCVEPNGNVVANRDRAAEWERITVQDLGGGTFALKSHHGKYLSAQPRGTIEGNRDRVAQWETFIFA